MRALILQPRPTSPLMILRTQLACVAALAVAPFALHAATWTNFNGTLRWGANSNWSPNTFPNGDGAVADFQVDVPFDITNGVTTSTGGNLTPLLTTLKLGDTNGAAAILINKGGASTSRLHFANSLGNASIEKRGD